MKVFGLARSWRAHLLPSRYFYFIALSRPRVFFSLFPLLAIGVANAAGGGHRESGSPRDSSAPPYSKRIGEQFILQQRGHCKRQLIRRNSYP